jgi:hypothetical protein
VGNDPQNVSVDVTAEQAALYLSDTHTDLSQLQVSPINSEDDSAFSRTRNVALFDLKVSPSGDAQDKPPSKENVIPEKNDTPTVPTSTTSLVVKGSLPKHDDLGPGSEGIQGDTTPTKTALAKAVPPETLVTPTLNNLMLEPEPRRYSTGENRPMTWSNHRRQ